MGESIITRRSSSADIITGTINFAGLDSSSTKQIVIQGLNKEPKYIVIFPIASSESSTLNNASVVSVEYVNGSLTVCYSNFTATYRVSEDNGATYEYSNGTVTISLGTANVKRYANLGYLIMY